MLESCQLLFILNSDRMKKWLKLHLSEQKAKEG